MNQRSASEGPYLSCAKTFLRGMAKLLQGLFESVDNTLFELAEKAESNSLQSHYFDGMRQVRKTRSSVEKAILRSLRTSLIDYQKGTSQQTSEPVKVTEESMTLVDESDLERNLAISEMVAKGENRLSRQLFAISQRIGNATGKTPPDDAGNPVGPAAVCSALQDAGGLFEIELPVLLVIYKLFDREVLEHLDGLYEQINAGFISQGVIPRLKHQAATSSAPHGRGGGTGAEPTIGQETADQETHTASGGDGTATVQGNSSNDANDEVSDAASTEILESILSLLSARRGPTDTSQVVSEGAVRPASGAQTQNLLNALSVLQSAKSPAQPGSEDVKAQVLSQMGKLGDQAHTSSDEEDTIDLVAMLFDFILNDPNLPQPMQLMLARLQIPYIKVALIDRHLFASRRHPARRLLDTLADLAMNWSAETDRGNRLHDHLEGVVERIVKDFDDDLDLFDELRKEVNRYVERLQKRAQVAEKRTTAAAEGTQRLQQARRTASDIINKHLDGPDLPSIVTEILSKPWANVLVLTCLRHGKDSEDFARAEAFVHQLIWSTEPKTDKADVARLQSELPQLTAQLRAGLEMVAYHHDDIKRVFKSLKALYRSMLDRQYRDQLTLPTSPPPPTMSLPAAVAPVQLPMSGAADLKDSVFQNLDDEPESLPLEELEQVLREQVESLEVGTWFQFTSEDGQTQRAKLSWKSPITGKYLFVDHKGIKISDKPVATLAQELANGEVIALETLPLFDRALSAIAERLGGSDHANEQTNNQADEEINVPLDDQASSPTNMKDK